ncbi:SOS response-associated peptidase [Actinopolymorpha cephalotaxi]|uniref:Abasic site processing protein n=1 Tax=Actinopolymorpha cephalotaxi TaxID=504797 RepID=A0ABX2RYB2_9ACTN|nr:SOS response-associated peptidase [Actinopolymorpha cephalotaxi]NYH81853.1 putative SOS response-associated peptidase YedK [Actinopolymorpha cephalotaxi]
MCGRYSLSRDPEDLAREFEVTQVDVREKLADYNVAPTKQVAVVVDRPPRRGDDAKPATTAKDARTGKGGEGDDAGLERHLRTVRWGLIPFWAKDPKIGNRLINARLETAAEKPAFRKAFASRRCLVPADGYYEWYGEKKGHKQPFFIHRSDGGVLAMAGLYEIWRDPDKGEDDPDRFVWTCTVLTTTAEDELGRIHDRMPLLVEPAEYSTWLDPRRDDADQLRSVLVPAAPGRLDAYPVSTEVNNVRNNGPQLLDPLPAEEAGDVADPR